MATFGALAATGQAIVGLLSNAGSGHPEFRQATFRLATSADMQRAPSDGMLATAYLYRTEVNTTRRNLPPRRGRDGDLHPPAVPVDLHYLVTAWSKDAVTQHRLLGWCIRTLHDTPTLNAGVLNQFGPEPAFRPEETIDLTWEVLTRQEMTDAWEIAKTNSQPSLSFLVRTIEIESDIDLPEPLPVQTIDLRYVKAGA